MGSSLLSRLRSTIGVPGLSFSVRDGKRRNPGAVAALDMDGICGQDGQPSSRPANQRDVRLTRTSKRLWTTSHSTGSFYVLRGDRQPFGRLVALGCGVTAYTPAPYLRRGLRRPSRRSSLAAGFALRCFQRLSLPDTDTRRCAWRHNRQTGGRAGTVLSY